MSADAVGMGDESVRRGGRVEFWDALGHYRREARGSSARVVEPVRLAGVESDEGALMEDDVGSRAISFGTGSMEIPERLLLAHGRGEVLFVCGGRGIDAGRAA